MTNVILHDQINSFSMASAVIKIVDVKDSPLGEINVQVEFSPKIDINSPSHRFVNQVVEWLQAGKLATE